MNDPTDREADIAELLEIDELLNAAGFPPLDAETAAQAPQWSPERLINVTVVQFARRWKDATQAVAQAAQRCAICQAEHTLCSSCAADRAIVYRLAGAVFFLCRVFAERARQAQQRS